MPFFIDDFERNVQDNPNNIALVTNTFTWTYHELNERANRAAHFISEQYGVGQGERDCVAILSDKSPVLLILILAAWKLNAGVTLLHTDHPENANYLIEKIRPKLIAQQDHYSSAIQFQAPVTLTAINIDELRHLSKGYSSENPKRDPLRTKALAYYIPTSGSTGLPKIIEWSHTAALDSGLNGSYRSIREVMELKPGDVELWDCPNTFDPVYTTLGQNLAGGSAVYIPTPAEMADPTTLFQNCVTHHVNVMTKTPTQFPILVEHASLLAGITNLNGHEKLKLIATGADLANVGPLWKICKMIGNGFGRTEEGPGTTMTRVHQGKPVSIGHVMRGRDYEIVHIAPGIIEKVVPGDVGEMICCVEGFEGYLTGEDKDTLVFEGKIWQRTGDLVCYQVDEQGKIERDDNEQPILKSKGRKDGCIKVAGVRIDPNGYEATLKRHSAVEDAHTITLGKGDHTKIITFVKARNPITPYTLQKYLREKTSRVISHQIVVLNDTDQFHFHRTANNKVDKKSLLKEYASHIAIHHDTQDLEESLLRLWRHMFGLDTINIDSKFDKLGGSSLDFVWLMLTLLNEPFYQIHTIDPYMISSFKSEPTISHLSILIHEKQEREKHIKRIHMERDAPPLFVLGSENNHLNLPTLSSQQPIIQIDTHFVTDPQQLIKIIKEHLRVGPYFIIGDLAGNDLTLLHDVSKQLDAEFLADIQSSDLHERLNEHYQYYCKRTVIEKIEEIHRKIALNLNSAITSTLEKSLMVTLDITSAEFSYLFDEKFTLIIRNVFHPQQIKAVLTDPLLKQFKQIGLLFEVKCGLYFKHEFEDLLPLLHNAKIVWDESIPHYDDNWYQQQVDRLLLPSRAMQAECYDRYVSYARELAQLSQNGPICVKRLSAPWDKDFIPEQRSICNVHDKAHYACLLAQPVEITESGNQHVIHYMGPQNFSLNPYRDAENQVKKQFDCVVTRYNTNGYKPPLFLMPPITGLEVYHTLAAYLDPTQPIYSLRHPLLTDLKLRFSSIEELSAFYVGLINAIYPIGPIYLAGWSFGGIITNEMAHQLQAVGRVIAYVGVIDTPGPLFTQALLASPQQHRELLWMRLNWFFDFYKIPNKEQFLLSIDKLIINTAQAAHAIWQMLHEHIKSSVNKDDDPEQYAKILAISENCKEHYWYSLCYQSSLHPAAHLYLATESSPYYPVINHPQLGWESVKSITTHSIAADHFSIVEDPACSILAQLHNVTTEAMTKENVGSMLDETVLSYVRRTMEQFERIRPGNYIKLYDIGERTEELRNELILGPSLSGKSTCLQEIFIMYARSFLSNQRPHYIPLFMAFKNHRHLQDFFASLGLSSDQSTGLLENKDIILFIDGIDEAASDAFLQSMRYLDRLNIKNVVVIASCKEEYYKYSNSDLKRYLSQRLGCVEVRLSGLTLDQFNQYTKLMLLNRTDDECRWLHQYIALELKKDTKLTLKYVENLIKYGFELARRHQFIIRHYRSSELFELRLNQLAHQSKIPLTSLLQFAQHLAVALYELDPQFLTALKQERSDTDELAQILNLQAIGDGLAFYHRSDQEYFFATVLFDELVQGVAQGYLHRFNLALEHDVLGYISQLYQDYVLCHPERYQYIQLVLHDYIRSAFECEENKTLAANAVSILAVCHDAQLVFPESFNGIWLGDINIVNACLDKVDFSGVAGSQKVILDGAIFTDLALLPAHWCAQLPYAIQREPNILGFQRMGNDSISVEKRNCNNDDEVFYFTSLDDPNKFTTLPSCYLNADFNQQIIKVVLHQNGENLAIFCESPNCYKLQFYEGNHLISNFFLSKDNQFRPGFMTFHKTNFVLFAFNWGLKDNRIQCLSIFDPMKKSHQIITGIESKIYYFVLSYEMNFLVHAYKGNFDSLYHEYKDNIVRVRNATEPDQIVYDIRLEELIEGNYTYFNLRNIYSCDINPYLLFYILLSKRNASSKIVQIYSLHLYDLKRRMVIASHEAARHIIKAVFSQFSNDIAYVSANSIYLWNPVTGTVRLIYQLGIEQILEDDIHLIFDKDKNQQLNLLIYCKKNNMLLHTLHLDKMNRKNLNSSAHTGSILYIIMHPTRPLLITSCDTTLCFWDVHTFMRIYSYDPDHKIGSICLSHCGQFLFCAVKLTIHVIEVQTGKVHAILSSKLIPEMCKNDDPRYSHDSWEDNLKIHSMVIDPSNPRLLILQTFGEKNRYYCDWKKNRFMMMDCLKESVVGMLSACGASGLFAIDKPRYFAQKVYLFDNGSVLKEFNAHFLSFSPCGRYIVVYDQKAYKITIMNTYAEMLHEINVPDGSGEYRYLVFSHDGNQLIIADNDGMIGIWDVTARCLVNTVRLPTGSASTLCCSQENMLYVGTNEGDLFAYHLKDLRLLLAKSSKPERVLAQVPSQAYSACLWRTLKEKSTVNIETEATSEGLTLSST